jgi:hypothetical protein
MLRMSTGGCATRLGFIKLAIREGYDLLPYWAVYLCVDVTPCSADLVPVFSFGENDVRALSPSRPALPL